MRPMDCKGLHGRNAEPIHEMPSLPLWLQPHHLFANSHLCRVQVKLKTTLRKSSVSKATLWTKQPGYIISNLDNKIHTQLLWFTEPEPESFLQPDLDLPGNVATEHPRDLREPDNQLHQPDIGANEKEIPKVHGWEGAHDFAHQGLFCFWTKLQI